MGNNIFEKVDKLEEGQQEILEMLQKMQQGASASSQGAQNGANPDQAQMQREQEMRMIKSFMQRASKKLFYLYDAGNGLSFSHDKTFSVLFCILFLIVGAALIPVVTIAAGMYNTFTFLENLWMLLVLISLVFVARAKRFCKAEDLHKITTMRLELSKHGFMIMDCTDPKLIYRIARVLAYIGSAGNFVCVWLDGRYGLAVLAVLLEIAFIKLTGVVYEVVIDGFFVFYEKVICYTGYNEKKTEKVTIISYKNQLYPKEDFEKKFILRK